MMTDATGRMNALALAALQMNKVAVISHRQGKNGQANIERECATVLKEMFQEMQDKMSGTIQVTE